MSTKDSILRILSDAGGYVSGERISEKLGISRAAVNSAIMGLRSDGWQILSATNRGYLLSGVPDSLSSASLSRFLSGGRMERVVCLDTVDSTNKYLRELEAEGAPDGTAVIANEQTAGRGRLGRTFESAAGCGIYLSYLLRPDTSPSDTAPITAMTAVIVRNAILECCRLECGVKWVNDIVCGSKKLCGILTEMSLEGESGSVRCVVIGIGINANQTPEDFSPDIAYKAASIFGMTGKRCVRAGLAAKLIEGLDGLRGDFKAGDPRAKYLESYRGMCVTSGRDVRVVAGSSDRLGRALGVDDDFRLIVRFEDGSVEAVPGGEVSVRGMYGYL